MNDDFRVMLDIWGYAVSGRATVEALICENGGAVTSYVWDNPDLLERTHFNNHRPPDWYACYWIGEHVRRGHAVP